MHYSQWIYTIICMTQCQFIEHIANTNICYSNLLDNLINLCTSSNKCLFSFMPNSVLLYSKTAVVTLETSTTLFTSSILVVYLGQFRIGWVGSSTGWPLAHEGFSI